MTDPALDIVEFLLTTQVYNDTPALEPDDVPPRYRRVYMNADAEDPEDLVERPLEPDVEDVKTATGVERPWDAVSELLFTDRDTFAETVSLTQPDLAMDWLADRIDAERLETNPVLSHALEDHEGVDADYEAAKDATRPLRADRVWIDGLLSTYFDDEDDEEMLDLVDIWAPEEIEIELEDLVLTPEQEGEIEKLTTAIENRDYLARIGLREIGKLLFVGPPGTGKTSIARALAADLDLPVVEVKLSMITSQYLGETAKNVEKTFEVARRLAPCVLFIDEFDFVAKTRRSDEHAAIKRAVNTLLKAIDNISLVRDDVLLIGATNHPDQLDAAAWRRFDEIVNFPKPDDRMRADILRVITQQMDIQEFDPFAIAKLTSGMTGSDLRLVIREAVLEALTDGRRTLTQQDLEAAVRDFEERDNLKNLDMIEGDHEALVAGGDISGSGDGGDGHGDHDPAHDGGHHQGDGHSHGDAGAEESADATTGVRTADH